MGSPSYGLPIFKRWIKSLTLYRQNEKRNFTSCFHSHFALRLPQSHGLFTRQRDRLCSEFGADHRLCCDGVSLQKATSVGTATQ